MRRYVLFLTGCMLAVLVNAQNPTIEKAVAELEHVLTEGKPAPQVLILGSFHFGYYNLDAHKTDAEAQIDVLDPQRQKELDSLVELLLHFQPTKIAVESGPITGYLMHQYRSWLKGKEALRRNEIDQIGFRLMRAQDLDTIYGINDHPLVFDLWDHRDSSVLHPIIDSIYADWDFQSEDSISMRYDKFYDLDDRLGVQMPLYDYFALMNDDRVLDRGYGAYLNGDFTLGDDRGADALAMHWYSRNLRIYRNIQDITTSPEDRILVIIGAGHATVLTHLFACSPQYELVKFSELYTKEKQ